MSEPTIIEEIQENIRDLVKSQKETDRQLKASAIKNDREFEKLRKSQKETAQQIKASAIKNDREFEKLRKSQEKTDLQIEEMVLQVKKTSKTVGEMTNKWGLLTEQFAKSKLPQALEQFGYSNFIIHDRSVSFRKNGTQKYEYDIIAVNGDVVVPVEVKYKLQPEDINKHIERLHSFRDDMPQLAREKVFGAIVCVLLNKEAKTYAIENGLLLIQVAGEASNNSKVLNPKNFQPKNFK